MEDYAISTSGKQGAGRLPDLHEKVIRTVATCRTSEQRRNALRFAGFYYNLLLTCYAEAADSISKSVFCYYIEKLRIDLKEV